jgi:hypothetical protein
MKRNVWRRGGGEARNSIAERQHVLMTSTYCYACELTNRGVIRVLISSAITRGKTTEVQSGVTNVRHLAIAVSARSKQCTVH